MELPVWLHLCTVWYIVSNFIIARKSWSALPAFFALSYTCGLIGGLGDHVEPWVPVKYHWITEILETYGRFPLAFGVLAIVLRYTTLASVPAGSKLRILALLAITVGVLVLYRPVEYNTNWIWHLVHSTLVHGLTLVANFQVFNSIVREQTLADKAK